MSKLTPSTARTSPTVRSMRTPDLIGKCFCRSVTLEERAVRAAAALVIRHLLRSRAPARSLVGCAGAHQWPGRTSRSSGSVVGAAVVRGSRTGSAARSGTRRGGAIRSGGRPGIAVRRPLPDALALELRQRAEQRLGVRVLGVVEEVERRAPAPRSGPAYMTTMSSAASATTPMSWVMMIIAMSCSCAQVLEQVEDLRLDGHVERRRRLVGDQQLRVAGERDRDHHALAHPAREAVRVVVEPLGRVRDPHLLEQLDRPLARVPPCQRRGAGGSTSVICVPILSVGFSDVIGSWKIIAISLPRTSSSSLLGERRQVAALEEDLALDDLRRRLRDQAHDRERGHGLAAARLADDPERLALLDART